MGISRLTILQFQSNQKSRLTLLNYNRHRINRYVIFKIASPLGKLVCVGKIGKNTAGKICFCYPFFHKSIWPLYFKWIWFRLIFWLEAREIGMHCSLVDILITIEPLDLTSHKFRASKSVERHFGLQKKSSIATFEGSKNVKYSVRQGYSSIYLPRFPDLPWSLPTDQTFHIPRVSQSDVWRIWVIESSWIGNLAVL